jgi:hypothetical protein
MRKHARLIMRILALSAGLVVLIAAHGAILGYLSSHMALPATAVAAVVVLMVLKHLGWLGALFALLRRRSQ